MKTTAQRLNPFEIRASVQRRTPCKTSPMIRLNPFEIRASVQPKGPGEPRHHRRSLNPFEIRASVQLQELRNIASADWVSIPLKSGHRFNRGWQGTPVPTFRLNPFEIRASVQQLKKLKIGCEAQGLNPFEIRASVQRYHRPNPIV